MEPEDLQPVLTSARAALETNRLHGLTVPHRRVFPAAYLWDTAVVVKGIATFDPPRAAAETLRYLQAQWADGMLPNEVYYEPIRLRAWLFGAHTNRPPRLTTSGITQPPMLQRSALEVARRLPAAAREDFVRHVLPPLVAAARWVLTERLGDRDLAVVIHAYETGMDNRIDLAELTAREWLDVPAPGGRAVRAVDLAPVWAVRRLVGDTRTLPVAQRASHADVLAAYRQTRHIRRLHYDLDAIRASGRGVLVEDVGFNAVLLDALACLLDLAEQDGAEVLDGAARSWLDDVLRPATQRLAAAIEGLWCPAGSGRTAGYYSRDHRTGTPLLRPTVAGLFPLLRTRDADRVAVLLEALADPGRFATRVAPPAAPADSAGFEPNRYWRGAAWSFPLDIVETALRERGELDAARDLRRRYLTRPHGAAHAEYENPLTGAPRGARPFSPAAALTLRLAELEGVPTP